MILKLLALCAVVGMSASEACGGAVSGTTGTIQFPSVPGRYPHSTKCEWIITTPPETRVHLTFSYFYLERKYEGRCYDFFVIRDGDNWKSPKLSKRLCGFKTPSDVTATGNVMYLKFKSDHYHNFWGFHATWSSQPAANETSGSLE